MENTEAQSTSNGIGNILTSPGFIEAIISRTINGLPINFEMTKKNQGLFTGK